MNAYDLYPAALMAIIITVSAAAGFTLGALTTILFSIITPTRRRRISLEEREARNITALFDALPKPATHIPPTTRKAHHD